MLIIVIICKQALCIFIARYMTDESPRFYSMKVVAFERGLLCLEFLANNNP